MNLKQGTLLKHGEYRIERELGHGGFGVTYLATQVGLNRRVAIKEFFMSEYCNRDVETSQVTVGSEGSKELVAKFRKKFIKEAQTIAEMDNHHIIRIHDVFEDNGTAYYVMEYLSGGDLRSRIPSGGMPEAEALGYIREVADALRYIHSKNILHLDIKPTNILFRGSGEAVLIDFGISKHYDDEGGNQTSSTPVGISEGYAPTEQYEREGVSSFAVSTDIYSLGATLYCLLSGNRPPKASIVLNEGLPELPSCVSAATRTAVEHAMQPRRKDRPQSVDAFLALLDAEVDESTHLEVEASSTSPRGGSTPFIAEEDVEDKHSKKALSPFKGDADAKGASVTTKEALASPRSPRRGNGARHDVAEGVNNEAEPTPLKKKLLILLLVCVVEVVAFVLWPKGGDTPVKEEVVTQQTEILPPAGRQNNTGQQQYELSQQQQTLPVKSTAELYVNTTPSGAVVYVDGKSIGHTPIDGVEIANGKHTIKLLKEGYCEKTIVRTIENGIVKISEPLFESKKTSDIGSVNKSQSYTVKGVSFTMVTIAGGTFTMGSLNSDVNAYDDEKPARQVKLGSYSIGETEVTQALWQAVMGSNPSYFIGDLRRPVENVSWDDCKAFIHKLNTLTGAKFRFPTEAEWEYAARGGNSSIHKFSGSKEVTSVAWYASNSQKHPHAVKSKSPNRFGLYDMSGNVWEWCSDWKGAYSPSVQTNPKGPALGTDRVLRGGAWNSSEGACRVTHRYGNSPGYGLNSVGLRLAL